MMMGVLSSAKIVIICVKDAIVIRIQLARSVITHTFCCQLPIHAMWIVQIISIIIPPLCIALPALSIASIAMMNNFAISVKQANSYF